MSSEPGKTPQEKYVEEQGIKNQYKKDFEALQQKSRKTQKQVVDLINTSIGEKTMSAATYTRIKTEIPKGIPRFEGLIIILSVLYHLRAFDDIDNIKEFLDGYNLLNGELRAFGKNDWDSIKQIIIEKCALLSAKEKQPSDTLSENVSNIAENKQDTPLLSEKIIANLFDSYEKLSSKWVKVVVIVLCLIMIFIFISNSAELRDGVFASGICNASKLATPQLRTGTHIHKKLPLDNDVGLLSNEIRTIGISSHGVWVGYRFNTGGAKVSYFTGEKWVHCTGIQLKSTQLINSIVSVNGDIWFSIDATNDYPNDTGIVRLNSTGWRYYTVADGLPSNIVYRLWTNSKELWASTYKGVAKFTDGHWQLVYREAKTGLPCANVHDFFRNNEGDWLALVNCGIVHVKKDGTMVQYFNQPDDLRKNARAIASDQIGGVWVATDGGGLVRFIDGKTETFINPQILSNNLNDIKIDKFGRIWVASNKGVAYTPNLGQTWFVEYSQGSVLHLVFGCSNCSVSDNQVWYVLDNNGLISRDLPPQQ
jgi:hypothetical protein